MTINRNPKQYYSRTRRTDGDIGTYKKDTRVSWIYEQYRNGKAVTIDDFKYLRTKDPEGCKRLIQSIIKKNEAVHNEERNKMEQSIIQCIHQMEDVVNSVQERMETLSDSCRSSSQQTLTNVKLALGNIKEMVQVMDHVQLCDMMEHLYQANKLKEQYEAEIMGWEMLLEEADRFYAPYLINETDYYV